MRKIRWFVALGFAACILTVGLVGLAAGDDVEDGADDAAAEAPEPISEETLIDSSFNSQTLQATEIYEYDYEDGICTHIVRFTVPFLAARDDPVQEDEQENGEAWACAPESAEAAKSSAREVNAAIRMQVFAFGSDLIVLPRLRADVARITVVDKAGLRVGARAQDLDGSTARFAHVEVAAPSIAPPAARTTTAGDTPSTPELAPEAAGLRVIAYNSAGRAIAKAPVFPEAH